MGFRLWALRRDKASFVRVPYQRWWDFLEGKAELPPETDGYVYLVELAVEVAGRTLTEVRGVWFYRWPTNRAGRFVEHRKFLEAQGRAASEKVARLTRVVVERDNIIARPGMFAERKYEWKPTEAEYDELRAILWGRPPSPSPPRGRRLRVVAPEG